MYVYRRSEEHLWTVGFFDPKGEWNPESDWSNPDHAVARVHFLNGGENVLPERWVYPAGADDDDD